MPPAEVTAAADELTAAANDVNLDVNFSKEEPEGAEQDESEEGLLGCGGKGAGKLKGDFEGGSRMKNKVPARFAKGKGQHEGMSSAVAGHPYDGKGIGNLRDTSSTGV